MAVDIIEVDIDTLRQNAKEVTTFIIGINHACKQLQSAWLRFESSITEEDTKGIESSVNLIQGILKNAVPDLELLSKRITSYADYVDEVKKQLT